MKRGRRKEGNREIKNYSDEPMQAVNDMGKGPIRGEERYKAVYDSYCWQEEGRKRP